MMTEMNGLRLNLGAGGSVIEGYTSVDRKTGQEVYPLAYDDNTADEIYASHVLEHFSHTEMCLVLQDWFRVLRPGGRLRVAVPDFAWIAEHYIAGEPINTQGYVMGGHVDPDDRHGSIVDYELLVELLINAGFERIGRFLPEYHDCTQLPVSLNMMGFKPTAPLKSTDKTVAVLSAPRFGPVLHFRTVGTALASAAVPYYVGQGAYWHCVLSNLIEDLLETPADYIITVDYDSVFSREEVLELYRLMRAFPEADAICGVQMRRGKEDVPMIGVCDKDGGAKEKTYLADFNCNLTKINTGHFGLTIIKADKLRALPRPWMYGKPGADGRWTNEKIDPDIDFWLRWREAGNTLYLANKVLVGHLVELIRWPATNMSATIWQEPADYIENGITPKARRGVTKLEAV